MNQHHAHLLDENSVLLISGGARGITAQCAIKIAEAHRGRFILVGRSGVLEREPDWAGDAADKAQLQKKALELHAKQGEKMSPKALQKEIEGVLSSREILSTLKQIKEKGGEALYISSDVTDKKRLVSEIQSVVKKFGPVTGIMHGAGALADKRIENKTAHDFDRVVGTKVFGLQNMLQAVEVEKLRFLVLFSSVAGFFGNAGQTDYAIANEILNKSAYVLHKSLPDCRVICVNWGPWEGGMVSPQLRKIFAERNIRLISIDEGVQTLLQELNSRGRSSPQVVVGSPIVREDDFNLFPREKILQRRQLNLAKNPFLEDHRIGPHAVIPATCAAAWLADACQSLHPGFSLIGMKDFKVLKGITLGEGDLHCEVEMDRIQSPDANLVIYEITVTSRNQNNRRVFHYSAHVTLAKEIPPRPMHAPIEPYRHDSSQFRDGSHLYQNGTLFHGPFFQGIQQVLQLDEKRVITEISLPKMHLRQQGQFPVRTTNPYVNDAVVQSLLIWSQENYGAPCLPSRLHLLEHYQAVTFDERVWAVLDVTFHNKHAVTGNILVQDEQGREYARFIDLEGTISKYLKRYFGKQVGES